MKTAITMMILLILILSINLFAENRIIFYHGNYGMVNETIELNLSRGLNEFSYDNIPSGLIDNTIMLLPVSKDAFIVQSQGFIREIRGFSNILRKHLNKNLEIVTKDSSIISGKLFYYDHELLAVEEHNTNNSIFIRIAEVRNYILQSDDFIYENAPKIVWKINTDRAGKYQAALTYLTSGFSWTGLYKAIWDGDFLNLEILAKITNNTGVDYENFQISLIAGDPKRISPPAYADNKMGRGAYDYDMMAMESAAMAPQFVSEELDEYYMYSYSAPVDLRHSESQQIRLFPPKQIKPEVYYEYITNTKVIQTKLKIINDEKSGLGIPLPRGTVQIYRKSESNRLNFVGEDQVEQRPVNEEWIISPGIAFDLVGETTVVATRRPTRNITENDMKVTLRNRSKETKTVLVTHYIRSNWTIQRQNHTHEQLDANRMHFRKVLQPNEEYDITWTERIEY